MDDAGVLFVSRYGFMTFLVEWSCWEFVMGIPLLSGEDALVFECELVDGEWRVWSRDGEEVGGLVGAVVVAVGSPVVMVVVFLAVCTK